MTSSSAQRAGRIFSHNTRAHKEGKYKSCNSCHTLPTKNWVSARPDKDPPFPDVRNYPYKNHTTCFGCHMQDVYRQGSGGAFCGSCHTEASMRARAVKSFPNRSHAMQFKTIFPHDVHQDLIASNILPRGYAPAHFVPVSSGSTDDDKPKPVFYNCAICHKSTERLPKYEMRKLTAEKVLSPPVADKFDIPVTAAFFKDSPDSHASCFSCHYQFQNLPEGKRDCSGCHALTQPYTEKNVVKRYSLKFNHDRLGHVEKDCATCHLRITQNGDVNTMKDADVPIVSCQQCHATAISDPPWQNIIGIEIDKREASIADKGTIFQCSYCHTSAIGRYEIPVSHRKP